jgi:hypothetical protein
MKNRKEENTPEKFSDSAWYTVLGVAVLFDALKLAVDSLEGEFNALLF